MQFRLVQTLQTYGMAVTSVAISCCGKMVAAGSADRKLCVWNLPTGELVHYLEKLSHRINKVALDVEKERIATAGGKTVEVRDLLSGTHFSSLVGHTREVRSVALVNNSDVAISGGDDKTMRLWDIKDQKLVQMGKAHPAWVFCIDIDKTGKKAVSASHDGSLYFWFLEGEPSGVWRVARSHGERLWTCCINENGTIALSAGGSIFDNGGSILRVWNAETGCCQFMLRGHFAPIQALSVSSCGTIAASGGRDGVIKIWDLKRGEELGSLKRFARVRSLALTTEGNWLLLADGRDALEFWDMS